VKDIQAGEISEEITIFIFRSVASVYKFGCACFFAGTLERWGSFF